MYALAEHCFACRIGDRWVILDVLRDRYVGVEDRHLAEVGSSIRGWPGAQISGNAPSRRGQATLESLLKRGILTAAVDNNKPFADCRARAVEGMLEVETADARPSFDGLARAMLSCLEADWMLRRWPLWRMVERLRRRGALYAGRPVMQVDLVKALVDFYCSRPFYPRRYLCLFDSLAAFRYLSLLGIRVDFVFGVVANPFEAHCWLQRDDVVINDELERVQRFKPIMVL